MTAFDVQLSWDGMVVSGLRAVGPLRRTVAVVTLYDGALGRAVKVPGRPDTGTVTLQREVTDDLTFDLWARGPQLHKEVELSLVDTSGGPTVTYRMHQCWVSEYVVGPDVASGLAVESVTLAMDFWERVTPPVPMLADQIAAQRQREVVRVDVGRLVGETTQETEKRIDRLLREAQNTGAVLLFDEADALFARRTDIADAHDRYAATPLDTVVSRLSTYPGPILVVPPDPAEAVDLATPPGSPMPQDPRQT